MKVGDLVRFKYGLEGLGTHTGIIVASASDGAPGVHVDVMWFGPDVQWRHRNDGFTSEMKMFLEVIREEGTQTNCQRGER